jgi:mRNA-degrading endonuclease RelE of RelBE toxin-antitoxin system
VRRLRKRSAQVHESLLRAIELLEADPFNLQGRADIRKLADVPQGEGQFRLRIGDYRLRYDVVGDEVVLHSMRPRGQAYR